VTGVLGYNGEWIGWYPAANFKLMQSYACELYWYTEVYDDSPGDWTPTDGGSGEFAAAGAGQAAYFRQIFHMDQWGFSQWLLPDKAAPVPYQWPACYTASPLAVTQYPGYDNWFYCGGPGNDPVKAPYCKSSTWWP
jgi:hypothetical protein